MAIRAPGTPMASFLTWSGKWVHLQRRSYQLNRPKSSSKTRTLSLCVIYSAYIHIHIRMNHIAHEIYTQICTSWYTYTHAWTLHTYIHACMRIDIHSYICTHIHTCMYRYPIMLFLSTYNCFSSKTLESGFYLGWCVYILRFWGFHKLRLYCE